MSATKRPGAVDGLRRGVGTAPRGREDDNTGAGSRWEDVRDTINGETADLPPRPEKPVRVTLNIPPALYRQLRKWTDSAADEIGVPLR